MVGNVAHASTYMYGWHGGQVGKTSYRTPLSLRFERKVQLHYFTTNITVLTQPHIYFSFTFSNILTLISSQCVATLGNSPPSRDLSLTTPLAEAIAVHTVQQQRRMRTGLQSQTEQSVAGYKIVLHKERIVSALLACEAQLVSVIYTNIPAQVKN